MKTIAIADPTTLVGKELRELLERRRELWTELRLLSNREEEIGTLVDVRGEAATVRKVQPESLEGVDLAFFCGSAAEDQEVLENLPAGTRAVVLSPDPSLDLGATVVAGINLEAAQGADVLISPHPAAVLLGHLLAPLKHLGLSRAVATFLQPASMGDEAALDEVLGQTRAILHFEAQPTPEHFPAQIAFNLLATPDPDQHVVRQLHALLGEELALSLRIVQAGIFHCFAVSLYCEFAQDPELAALREALADHHVLELVTEPERLGPMDAAARDEVLVGPITPAAATAGGYWIWAVMDNLTRGSALNAMLIATELLG